jgi:hypothetical protein
MNYTVIYNFDPVLNCGVINFNDKTVTMDFKDLFSIINFDKNFIYYTDEKLYPYYLRHNQKITYIEHLFKFDNSNIECIFKNNNPFDLRRENVTIIHKYHNAIIQSHNVLDYTLGHYIENGKDAYIMKNPMWKIMENGKEYILMYCEKDTICKLCAKSYQKIVDFELNECAGKKITWFKLQNGYIMGSNNIYIHQIIMNCYGNGKGTNVISIDHIDRNPLNNALENLRTATRKEQEQNSKGIAPGTKRERKQNAQTLPDGITHDMMRKYVCYCKDYANKEKTILREYFRVETHPKLDKLWSSTKSNKVSLQEKLQQANKVVDDLEHDIYPDKTELTLPKYVSLIISREKPHLVFEKRTNDMRLNVKMVLPSDYDLQEQLAIFNDKISTKYAGECIL